jgi:dethiobiotin synthetase
MNRKFFITGTDTNIGKTYISTLLLDHFNSQNLKTLGIKLISSGNDYIANQYLNPDALLLQKHSSVIANYKIINPINLKIAASPNIAAKLENINLNSDIIYQHYLNTINKYNADIYIFEGVGGWHVPINEHETMSNFLTKTELEVILIVGIKLGCLNHAILTYQAIEKANLKITGWIANCIDSDMLCLEENIETLKKFLPIPMLAQVKYKENFLAINLF